MSHETQRDQGRVPDGTLPEQPNANSPKDDQDDEFIHSLFNVVRRHPKRSLGGLATCASALVVTSWMIASIQKDDQYRLEGIRERNAIEGAFRRIGLNPPDSTDLVSLIDDFAVRFIEVRDALEEQLRKLNIYSLDQDDTVELVGNLVKALLDKRHPWWFQTLPTETRRSDARSLQAIGKTRPMPRCAGDDVLIEIEHFCRQGYEFVIARLEPDGAPTNDTRRFPCTRYRRRAQACLPKSRSYGLFLNFRAPPDGNDSLYGVRATGPYGSCFSKSEQGRTPTTQLRVIDCPGGP